MPWSAPMSVLLPLRPEAGCSTPSTSCSSLKTGVVQTAKSGAQLAQRRARSSAHRFLHERAYPCLVGGGQLRQSVGVRPHVAFVELRLVAESERGVPRLELLRGLEEADDLALFGVRGHAVPGFRRQPRHAGFDDGVE